MSVPIERHLAQIATGRLARTGLDLVLDVIEAETAAVDHKMLRAMAAGPLDIDAAVQAWYEKGAWNKLKQRLEQQSRAGEGAGRRIQGQMEG